MCRRRGRIVLVGVAGLHSTAPTSTRRNSRFQVSCSYGPGRYDPGYEQAGHDYPIGFVRWTEQRNFEAVLELMASKTLDVLPLVSHRFALSEAIRAYDLLAGASEPYLGILLEYPQRVTGMAAARTIHLGEPASQLAPPRQPASVPARQPATDSARPPATESARPRTTEPASPAVAPVGKRPVDPVLGVIGAGNYASRVLIPAFIRSGARLLAVASSGGVTATHVGRRYGIPDVTTDAAALIGDPRITTIVVATRHDSHAAFVKQALAAGKHVFVEKPLAINPDELDEIESTWRAASAGKGPLLMVGFNRRFAPLAVRMKALLQGVPGPKSLIVTVNAGAIGATHSTPNPRIGGENHRRGMPLRST